MNFKKFLIEYQHRNPVDGEGDEVFKNAVKIAREQCGQALTNPHCVIYRGTHSGSEHPYEILHGEAGERMSANTTNHYTVILDHVLGKRGYPKRSASIICSTDEGKAEQYGTVYRIFPFDNVVIGVCPTFDIFHTFVDLDGSRKPIYQWNDSFDDWNISDSSWEDFLESAVKSKMPEFRGKTKQEIESMITLGYAVKSGFNTTTPNQMKKFPKSDRELWIGGKCLAIREDKFEEFMDAANDNV